MRCEVCGRELKEGQMFCQCGNTLGSTGAALDVNRDKKAGKLMLLAVLAGFLVFAVMATILVAAFLSSGKALTDRSKWENISQTNYSITLPANMKEADIDPGFANLTHLNTYRSGDAVVCVSYMPFTADQKRFLKRKQIVEMIKEWVPEEDENGQTIIAQEHGELVYFEYAENADGIFFGSSDITCVEAFYVSNDALYSIDFLMPAGKYAEHQDVVFAWMDSFRPKS